MVRNLSRPLLLLAAASPLISIAYSHAATPPRSLVLRTSDLPAGFRWVRGQVISNALVQNQRHMTAAQMRGYGRVTGYDSVFVRTSKGTTPPVQLANEVVTFKNADGAHRYFSLIVQSDLLSLKTVSTFHRFKTSGLGTEAAAFSYAARSSLSVGRIVYSLTIVRRGSYLANVTVVGPEAKLDPQAAIAYGRTLDNRLKSAH